MRYQHSFSESFTVRIQNLSVDHRKVILSELKSVLDLEEPREKGGEYLKSLWAYPFQRRSAFICWIDDEKRLIEFLDYICL